MGYRALVTLLALVFAVSACGETDVPADSDGGFDGGTTVDGGLDGGDTSDAGDESDGGNDGDGGDLPDGGTDGGDEPDGGDGGDALDGGDDLDGGDGGENPDGGSDGGDEPDGGEPTAQVLQFIAIGDTGEGNEDQYMVADAIKAICDAEEDGCDFVVMLGDNIYESGVTSVHDPQWVTKFEKPYEVLDLPFYAVLGNHDYGGIKIGPWVYEGGVGADWGRGPHEVEYTNYSDKWNMPATHYTMKHQNACFMMLDTNSILWDDKRYGDQKAWYGPALAEMQPCDWVFVAGHHPYKSNGKHGNAGNYEGFEWLPTSFIPIMSGTSMKEFYDGVVCPHGADMVLTGHDHNRQWLADTLCGAELVISGAGAKLTPDQKRGVPYHFQDFDDEGFFLFRVEGRTLTGTAYDKYGNFQFERVIRK